jgi:hypothetical protein
MDRRGDGALDSRGDIVFVSHIGARSAAGVTVCLGAFPRLRHPEHSCSASLHPMPGRLQERKEVESAGRGERGAWDVAAGSVPLVFAGGPTATSNPEPFSDFFDFFALGDGEELLPEIGQCLRACRAEGLSRDATLMRLATTVEGVYVPQFYEAPPVRAGRGGGGEGERAAELLAAGKCCFADAGRLAGGPWVYWLGLQEGDTAGPGGYGADAAGRKQVCRGALQRAVHA